MKRILLPLVLASLIFSSDVLAENAPETPLGRESTVTAVITGPTDVGIGRTLILDGSASRAAGERTEYRWTIEETGQTIGRTAEAIFTPERAGTLTFRLTVRSQGLDGVSEVMDTFHTVMVYKRKIVLLADSTVSAKDIAEVQTQATENGVFLRVVRSVARSSSLSGEDTLTRSIDEESQLTQGAESIVLWTDGIVGLQALMRSLSGTPDALPAIQNQTLVLLTRHSLSTIARSTQGALSILNPQELIITREDAMYPLLLADDIKGFKEALVTNDIEERSLTAGSFAARPWNVLSMLVNYLLSSGVTAQTIILLLVLPVIATIFTFLKQVIGITSFGLYTPSVITLSFLVLGWWTALLFLIFILTMGSLTRIFMQQWRLLYIPKVAITITVVSFTLLLLLAMGTASGIPFSRDTVFILLILSTLSENFYSLKSEAGWRSAIIGVSQTLIGAIMCVLFIEWQGMGALLLAYPELILLTIIINILLGRWTGLRLVEYFRFKELFLHLQEEE
ncbi:MAG: 7TM domain-containing protein [Candidatus Peribacteraceae bacterium]